MGGLTDFERRTFLDVVEGRLSNLVPTVVTTNWGLKDIAEKLDERIASRLAGLTQLKLVGDDMRMNGRSKPPERPVKTGVYRIIGESHE